MSNFTTFEQQLFKSADKLKKNIDAGEYKYVVLGLIFIKYISESFNKFYENLKLKNALTHEKKNNFRHTSFSVNSFGNLSL